MDQQHIQPAQGAGGLAVTGYLSGGVVNAPVTLTVDDLTAVKP